MGHPAAEQNPANSNVAPRGDAPTVSSNGASSNGASSNGALSSAAAVVQGAVPPVQGEAAPPFEHPSQLLLWGSFFAFTNLLFFRFLTAGIPAAQEYFAPAAGAVDAVFGWLAVVLTAVLTVGWAAFDLPSAWRGLTAGALTLPLVRFVLVLAAAVAGGALFAVDHGALAAASFWTSFPAVSLVLAFHAVLCAWVSRVIAGRTGVHLRGRFGRVNVIQRHTVLGSTETHDTMTRAGDLKIGDLIRLKKGAVVPCDALVEQGIAEVDERRFSGFAELRFKGEGQRIWAGSEVRSGEIFARVENLFPDAVVSSFTEVLDAVIARNRVPERWESIAHAIVLFAAACAGIHFFRDGAGIAAAASIVSGVLTAALFVDFTAYLPLLRGVALTRAFERGILCGEPTHLEAAGRVKSLVIDYTPASHIERFRIADFTVFDERLDSGQLVSALLSILGRSSDPFGVAAVEFLRTRIEEPLLHEVRDFMDYPGKGICAVVSGAEFSVGNELFLIERGVQIQSSEIGDEGVGEPVYVALGEEVAARFSVTGSAQSESADAVDRLHRAGVRTLLMSREPREVVDNVGKEMTLELAQITGGLSAEQYGDRLRNVGPALLTCSAAVPAAIAREASVLCLRFDELRFNVDPKAITVFRPGIPVVAEGIELGKRLGMLLRTGRIGGVVLGIAAALLGIAAVTPVWGGVFGLLAPVFLTVGASLLRRSTFKSG